MEQIVKKSANNAFSLSFSINTRKWVFFPIPRILCKFRYNLRKSLKINNCLNFLAFCHNSTRVGLIFLRNHKPNQNYKPNQTVRHFFSAPTQPNSTKFSMQPYYNQTRRFMQNKIGSPPQIFLFKRSFTSRWVLNVPLVALYSAGITETVPRIRQSSAQLLHRELFWNTHFNFWS